MPYNFRRVPIRADGATTLAAGGQLSIRLDQLQPLAGIAGGTTYLRSLTLEFDITAVGNGADTLGEDHLHDFLRSITLSIPGLDRQVINLLTYAGSRIRYHQHMVSGKRSRAANGGAGGTVTPAGGGGTAYRVIVELRFYLPRGKRPSDLCVPIQFLREAASVEVVYATLAAGYGGANITVTGTLVRQSVELEERPEFVFPVFFSLEQQSLGALTGQIPIAARVVHSIQEVAVQTDAAGQATIALASRTLVNFSFDGRMTTERSDTRTLNAAWNSYVAVARDEENADPAATPSWLPLQFPMADTVKLTQLPLAIGRPDYNFTGSNTSPILLVFAFDLNDDAKVRDRASRSNLRAGDPALFQSKPGAFLTAKTASKQPTMRGADSAARLPLRWWPEGAPAGR